MMIDLDHIRPIIPIFVEQFDDETLWAHPVNVGFGWLLSRSHSAARGRGKDFSLTLVDVINMAERAEGRCEVSLIPFSALEVNGVQPFMPSIDCINSRIGYTPENCRLVCYAVNVALHQWGDEVLRRIAEGVMQKARNG